MSLIRKHGAVLQAWACLDLVYIQKRVFCSAFAMRRCVRASTLSQILFCFCFKPKMGNDEKANYFLHIRD